MELFNRLYQTKFINVDLDKLSDELKRECFLFNKSILNETFGDYEYSVMNPYELQEFVTLQSKTGISYVLEDISENVLMGEFVIDPDYSEPLTKFLDKYEKMEKTVDIVLDKIFKHGIEKATKLDYKILKSKSV